MSSNGTQEPPINPLNRMLKIVFCLPGKQYSNNFLKSWSELLLYCIVHQIRPIISCQQGSNITQLRNKCLGADFLIGVDQHPFNNKIDYDFIMWIDSDQVFNVSQFVSLLRHNKDVVCGTYLIDSGTKFCTVVKWNDSYFLKHGEYEYLDNNSIDLWMHKHSDIEPEEIKDDSTGRIIKDYRKCKFPLMQVEYNGMGWMLIKKGVFEQLKYPWFEPITENHTRINDSNHSIVTIKELCSDDVSFCKRLNHANITIYLDINATVGHEKTIIL